MFVIACNSQEDSYTLVKEIKLTIEDMEIGELDDSISANEIITRSILENDGSKVSYLFEDHDTIGIFPEGGFEIPFIVEIPDLVPTKEVTLIANGWRTKDGVKYCSYLPFDRYNFDYSNRVPWRFAGIRQNGNKDGVKTGSKNSLFLATRPTETTPEGLFNAAFTHMGTIVRANYKLATVGTFKKACIVAPTARFALNGTYDLYADGQPFTPGEMSNHFDVMLDNLTTTASSTNVYVYYILSPDISNASGDQLIGYIWDDNGIRYRGVYTFSKATVWKRNGFATISFTMERESNNLDVYQNEFSTESEFNGVAIE